jgi:hypothetical protein
MGSKCCRDWYKVKEKNDRFSGAQSDLSNGGADPDRFSLRIPSRNCAEENENLTDLDYEFYIHYSLFNTLNFKIIDVKNY